MTGYANPQLLTTPAELSRSLGGPSKPLVIDLRPAEDFAAGHVPGAVSLPHRRINERNLSAYPAEVLFVVYCSGPHCNGADRAAVALARLGRPVKKMIGGIAGWTAEAFTLAS